MYNVCATSEPYMLIHHPWCSVGGEGIKDYKYTMYDYT